MSQIEQPLHDENGQPINGDGLTAQSLFVAHLATYPAITAFAGLAASFPVVKIFASNAVPLLMTIRERSRPVSDPVVKQATPVLERVDKFGDDLLTNVDKHFPQLQNTQPEEMYELVRRPVTSARSAAAAYSNAARGAVSARIVEPIKQVSKNARAQYAKVYDTKGKALIRSRLDPLILPLNDRLEGIIVDYLPEGEELPAPESVSNELSRTWRLARVVYHRARPALSEQAANVATIPQATRAHVREVYEDEVSKHSQQGQHPTTSGIVLAYIGTGRQLSSESANALISALSSTRRIVFQSPRSLFGTGANSNSSESEPTSFGAALNNRLIDSDGVFSRASNYVYGIISPGERSAEVGMSPKSAGSTTQTVANVTAEGELH